MPAYEAVDEEVHHPGNAVDPWVIVDFGEMLTVDKFLNQVGYANISASTPRVGGQGVQGPAGPRRPGAGLRPVLGRARRSATTAPQFFEYTGKNMFTKVAGWLQPVTPGS